MKRVKIVSEKYVTPLLKTHGFKKIGLNWNRWRGQLIDVISIQQCDDNSKESGNFTVTGGIFVPSFYEIIWQKKFTNFAHEADCPIRTAIGTFLDGESKVLSSWWKLQKDEDIQTIGIELAKEIEEYVMLFLEKIENMQDMHDYMESPSYTWQNFWMTKLYLALLKKALGNDDECTSILDSLINDRGYDCLEHAVVVKKHLQKVGLK